MKELLFSVTKKDFEITYFNGTGKGGQHRNKHANCVRLKHKETGIITTGQDHKSQRDNLKAAFKRMVEHKDFKLWLKIKTGRSILDEDGQHEKILQKVDRAMRPENLKVEYL